MRRYLALFLLLLLPLQFAYAAAAPYCALEKVDIPAHFGHHEHADSSPTSPADEPNKGALDDCGVCHLGSVHGQSSVSSVSALSLNATIVALPNDPDLQHFVEPSERPPRTPLA